MAYTVLLLTFMLVGFVTCQSTSTTDSNATSEKVTNKDEKRTTPDMEVLSPEESVDKFTFTKADAIPIKQKIQEEDKIDPPKDNAEDDPLVIFETILNAEKEVTDGDEVTVTIDKDDDNSDDDNDDDDDVDDDDDEEDEIDDDISPDQLKTLVSKPSDLQIRRQGDLDPQFEKKEQGDRAFPQSRQDVDNPYASPYITTKERIVPSDSAAENSPLLQLTQGGYQRPYSRRVPLDNQRPTSGIASQQSESVERPVGSQRDNNQPGPPQIIPQVTYANAYQPQMDYGAMQMLRHPFDSSGSFFTSNGPMQNIAPNPFFHAQPASYPEYTSANIQSPFTVPGTGYPDASRDTNAFAQYQTPPATNPNMMFQSQPQYVQPQPMSDGIPRPMYNPFQPGGFSPYTGINNAEAAPRPDYSAYFRSPAPINAQQFPVNPNFYGPVPNADGNGFNNPMIAGNLGPNNESPFSSRFLRYPVANNQVPPQNTDQQVQRQQQNSEMGTSDQKSKDSEQINVAQDKEDPLTVPFGTRIQRQNDLLEQNDFPLPRDVYIRYPMTEAGYATEENLPAQNTTERKTERNDAAKRPSFPFFAGGRLYPGFSSPDPYRNALNALQQGYPGDSSKTNNDEGNSTKENPTEQLSGNIPLRFNQGPLPPTNPIYSEYPGRSQDTPVIQGAPFYAPGADAVRNPFDQVHVFPERNYPFSAAEPIENAVEKNVTPECAKESNASLCFKDPEYPRRELLYALNSDSFLLDRLVMPDQQLDGIALVEQNTSESPEREDNYICKSDLKYGMPLRAKNIKGVWKVIVNIERAMGGGKFIQPVRLEVCRAVNEPCSFTTEMKTACVQKYSLQRLLSWSAEKGVHNDVYKLPVACSCQLVKV